jgi:hypothetical protein
MAMLYFGHEWRDSNAHPQAELIVVSRRRQHPGVQLAFHGCADSGRRKMIRTTLNQDSGFGTPCEAN